MDFLKAEPVTRTKPAILDDCLVQKQDPSLLKGYLGPTEEDAKKLFRERLEEMV